MVPTITARIPVNPGEEAAALMAILDKSGYQPRLSLSGNKLHVPLLPMSRPGAFRIPEQAEGVPLFLEAWELGGRKGDSGHGVVVCDNQGRPLKPFHVTTKSGPDGAHHAKFAAEGSIVIVQARFSNAKLDITGFDVTADYPIAWLDRFSIKDQNNARDIVQWRCAGCPKTFREQRPQEHRTPKGAACEGEIYYILQLPMVISQFEDAIQAAIAKASCPNCRHIHYHIPGQKAVG